MDTASIINLIDTLKWPATCIIIVWVLRRPIIQAISRLVKANVHSKGIDLVLRAMDEKNEIPFGTRKELNGLTSHDLWALFDIVKDAQHPSELNVPRRIAAITLMEAGLITVRNMDGEQTLVATALGEKLLATARSLSLPVGGAT